MRKHICFKTLRAFVLITALATTVAAQAASVNDKYQAQVSDQSKAMYPQIEAIYKDLHAHPEMGFQEVRTAGLLAVQMRALGFTVAENVGKTGVVAIFKNGPGPMVMVRTELDGLPMEEKTGLSYASHAKTMFAGRETFVAHSCGHDIHMASWLGTARILVAMKEQWHGTLMFVAQPAEELGAGAKAMVADGIFTRFGKPDIAFALHTGPDPYGTIGYNVGPITSNSNGLEIIFKGRGGHGSGPDKTIDPITIAAHFITDVQTVVSREKDPLEFGVVTIGAIQAGSVGNIIPDTAILRGTIRSYQPEVRAKLLDGIRRTAKASAMMAGAPEPIVNLDDGTDAVVNNENLVGRTEIVLKAAFGDKNVQRVPPITPSEDFSDFINQGIPAMYFFIGIYDPKMVADSKKPGGKPLAYNHSPFYAPVPEPSIETGILAMSLAVLNILSSN
jgi:amidohydrolase